MSALESGGTERLIELRGLGKSYQEAGRQRVILHEIDEDVRRGELVAILGRSGSGKSTLLNIISGIDLPTAGTVTIDGVDLTRLNEHRRTLFRRQHIGFVFQFYNLVPTLTVAENLLLPLELNGRVNGKQHRHAFDLLEMVGLAERAKSFPDQLSGGEQQRVAIGRALVHDPLLVLADEPTGNLDAETSQQVLSLLDGLTRQVGKTMLMVTHSDEAAELADRVLTIEDGRLRERRRRVAL
ncbi:MAG: ABC transporter ATP-binding protein [Dehalococcoidales bacterium]|nr:ABC transporter ATP-binding protein [Dehalococcoidales bacterium]